MIRKLGGAIAVVGVLALLADIPTVEVTHGITFKGDTVSAHCGGGQSSFTVLVPATTGPGPTPTPIATGTPTAGPTSTPVTFGGTVTIYTATDIGGVPGPTGSPYRIYPTDSTAYTQATSPPGYLYGALNSDQWVIAAYTSPSPASTGNLPGPRANLTIICSGANFPGPTST